MKNVQIIDGASNATYSLFQATENEFASIFPDGREMETIEDLIGRLGDEDASRILTPLWSRPILKRDVRGLHGTLFYDNEHRQLPASKREVDWDERSITPRSVSYSPFIGNDRLPRWVQPVVATAFKKVSAGV